MSPILTEPTTIDVVLHPSTVLPRRLLLAEAGDPDWTGTLDGRPLPLTVDERGMVVAPLDAPGRLSVSHEGAWRWVAPLQLAVMAALIVLSLPKRRTIDVDAQALVARRLGDDRVHVVEDRAEVEVGAFQLHAPGFDFGYIENIVDHLQQMLG